MAFSIHMADRLPLQPLDKILNIPRPCYFHSAPLASEIGNMYETFCSGIVFTYPKSNLHEFALPSAKYYSTWNYSSNLRHFEIEKR